VEITDRIVKALKNIDKIDPAKVTPTSHLINDLGLDSLDATEVTLALEDEFAIEIPENQIDNLLTVPDIVSFFSSHPHTK